jgi:hypothetical protein
MDYLDNVAFVVLRLQESSQPDEAHEAFQVVLREVERLMAWKDAAESGGGAGVRAARAEAEVERLRAREAKAKALLDEARAESREIAAWGLVWEARAALAKEEAK